MRFTLYYRGPLKTDRGPKDKQQLRRHFHPQLKCLWEQHPLVDFATWLRPEVEKGEISLVEPTGSFQFTPLISERIHMLAELDLMILRPGPPGALVSHGGDIDNRVKTLLDALRVPRESTALPSDERPLAFASDRHSALEITDYAERYVKDRLQSLPGVASMNIGGQRARSPRSSCPEVL